MIKKLGFLLLPAVFIIHPLHAANYHPTCQSSLSDPDGDGWGWENYRSCIVSSSTDDNADDAGDDGCDYSDAAQYSGWGWNPVTETSCRPLADADSDNSDSTNTDGSADIGDTDSSEPVDEDSPSDSFQVSGVLSGLARNTDLQLVLNENELITVAADGSFSFSTTLADQDVFDVSVERDPARQDCSVSNGEGVIDANSVVDVLINCTDDEAGDLFNPDQLQHMRITMTADEWSGFVLDTERAQYDNRDAMGRSRWTLWTHSEVYRQVKFEHLDEDGNLLRAVDNVGFKMRGNSSRQWPEIYAREGITPRRFHFTLKFDEKFDEDESVYACIGEDGMPAVVQGAPCWGRISNDLPAVLANDDREYMGVEKISFKFNKDDPTYQREVLAHELLNATGVPTGRVGYASVELVITGDSIYGQPLPKRFNMGVFMLHEQIDKPFLKNYFDKNGFLFKVNGGDMNSSSRFTPNCILYEAGDVFVDSQFCTIGVEKSDPASREEWLGSANYMNPEYVNSDINSGGEISQFAPYRPNYELKTKKSSIEEGRGLLQEFLSFLQTYPTASELAAKFDIDTFIKAQAADIVLGAVDHSVRQGKNYYLYFNPLTEKWVYITYDYDFVFRDNQPAQWGDTQSQFSNIVQSAVFPGYASTDWRGGSRDSNTPLLWDIVFADQSWQQQLYREINSLLDEHLDWVNVVEPKMASRRQMIESVVLAMDAYPAGGCQHVYNPGAIDSDTLDEADCDPGEISIRTYIEQRTANLRAEINAVAVD